MRMLLFSLGFSVLGVCAAAQAPTGQAPTTPQTSPSSQPASQPGMNNPGRMPTDTPGMSPRVDDKKFVKDAAVEGMTEVELGKLATQKGSSDAVKQFGQKLVDDHSKADDQLKQIASKENIDIPDSLDFETPLEDRQAGEAVRPAI